MNIPKDNREFIKQLEKTGDVKFVKREVDWDLEIGAMVRKTCEEEGPSLLFENVKDYPGHKVYGALIATFRRFAVALGLSPETPVRDIIAEYEERINKPIKPIEVSSAPCQENVVQGDEVDLFSLPVPMVHDGDGGRYIGTWHISIAKDPDSDWVNWGMYRLQFIGPNTMAGLCIPRSDQGRIFYGKYVPYNKPMPFAVAIGADPISSMVGMSAVGPGVSEVDYAGALMRSPIELTKAVTCDIPVPANAEIILEGEILPNVGAEEGPFGEYTGYRTAPRAPRSVYKVKAITYRNNPIFTMSCMGIPTDDNAIGMAITRSVDIKRFLTGNGVPVTNVYVPPEGASMLIVVQVKEKYSNLAQQIGQLLFGSTVGGLWSSTVIVVDEDVDIYNLKEVVHAWITKCHPVRDITVLPKAIGAPLHPFLDKQERIWSKGCKAIYDCTWPLEWTKDVVPQKSSFATIYPKEVQERILKYWKKDVIG